MLAGHPLGDLPGPLSTITACHRPTGTAYRPATARPSGEASSVRVAAGLQHFRLSGDRPVIPTTPRPHCGCEQPTPRKARYGWAGSTIPSAPPERQGARKLDPANLPTFFI